MDINFVIMGLFFTSAPSRPSVFHPPPPPHPSVLRDPYSKWGRIRTLRTLRTLLTPSEFRTGFPSNPFTAVASQFLGSRCEEAKDIGQGKKSFLFVSFMCRFSHIYNVSVLHTCVCNFLYIKCSDFLTFHGFVLFFFRSCPAPVFPIYDLIFLSYVRLRSFGSMIRSNFGSSVLCPVQR
jgi:hypothetical protein